MTEYKVDWTKPVRWNNGPKIESFIRSATNKGLTSIYPPSPSGHDVVYTNNGCGWQDGPRDADYVENYDPHSSLTDAELAKEYRELDKRLNEIFKTLHSRGYEFVDVFGDHYTVTPIERIYKIETQTVELEVDL